MKTMLLAGLLSVVVMASVWGYATWEEAKDAGFAKHRQGLNEAARADFEEALSLATNDYERAITFIYYGHTYFDEGNFKEARAKYDEVLALTSDPSSLKAKAEYLKGMSYYRVEDYSQARIEFAKVLEREVSDVTKADAQLLTAHCYYKENDNANAFVAYKAVFNYWGAPLPSLKTAFKKLEILQPDFVADWAIACNWLLEKSDSIVLRCKTDEEKQAYQHFAGNLSSLAHTLAKNHKLNWDSERGKYMDFVTVF